MDSKTKIIRTLLDIRDGIAELYFERSTDRESCMIEIDDIIDKLKYAEED